MNPRYQTRSIEIHDSATIWNPERIQKIVGFMVRHDMNTLIFHENDIVDKLVYPGLLYGAKTKDKNIYAIYRDIYESIYDKCPSPFVFIDEMPILMELMRSVVRTATDAGIRVFLQTKELWFADLVFRSGVVRDGVVCPTDPFFWETYLPAKYNELFASLPEISGIVTSTGTRESRTSLAHGICGCSRCKGYDLQQWQRQIIAAIHTSCKAADKELVVRDFTYYADEQNGLRAGMLDLPEDIVVSIKNTPQDFYPTFPHNPLIGNVGEREQWIEYEVMGEYFGFGAVPCSVVEDIRDRIRYGLSHGAKGFTARVDWEAMPHHSVFDTINALNIYAVAMFSLDPDRPAADVYRAYLEEYGLFARNLSEAEKADCIARLMSINEKTWPVMAKTCYINRFLFSSNSKIPADVSHGDFLAKEHHGLQKWFPEYANDLDFTPENVEKFLAEKDAALAEAGALYEEMAKGVPGLEPAIQRLFTSQYESLRMYAEMFRGVGYVYILLKAEQPDKDAVRDALRQLRLVEERMSRYKIPAFAYPTSVLLCPEKVRYFRQDAEERAAALQS